MVYLVRRFAFGIEHVLDSWRLLEERTDLVKPGRVVDVDMRDLMVGDGERRARAGVEHFEAELFANGDETLLPQHAVDVHGRRHVAQAVLRQDDDLNATSLEEGDEIAAQLVDLPDVGSCSRIARPNALQVVVEVRQIDER